MKLEGSDPQEWIKKELANERGETLNLRTQGGHPSVWGGQSQEYEMQRQHGLNITA